MKGDKRLICVRYIATGRPARIPRNSAEQLVLDNEVAYISRSEWRLATGRKLTKAQEADLKFRKNKGR